MKKHIVIITSIILVLFIAAGISFLSIRGVSKIDLPSDEQIYKAQRSYYDYFFPFAENTSNIGEFDESKAKIKYLCTCNDYIIADTYYDIEYYDHTKGTVLVTLKHEYSIPTQLITQEYFGDMEGVSLVKDLSYIRPESMKYALVNEDKYCKQIKIQLEDESEDNLYKYIEILNQREDVEYAGPNYIIEMDIPIPHSAKDGSSLVKIDKFYFKATIYAFKDTEIYNLRELFNSGELSYLDLMSIYLRCGYKGIVK